MSNKILISFLSIFLILKTESTIDLNEPELQFVSDHLTPLECRRLVAALHYKGFNKPNSLDEAELKIPKDVPCMQLLLHWNSMPNEGRGETHDLLQRRLRQLGKDKLAIWLGKTVFHEIGKDLQRSIDTDLDDLAVEPKSQEVKFVPGPTLQPAIENNDQTVWLTFDTVLYVLATGLLITVMVLCMRVAWMFTCRKRGADETCSGKIKAIPYYQKMQTTTSDSESEDKFDVRNHLPEPERQKLVTNHN